MTSLRVYFTLCYLKIHCGKALFPGLGSGIFLCGRARERDSKMRHPLRPGAKNQLGLVHATGAKNSSPA